MPDLKADEHTTDSKESAQIQAIKEYVNKENIESVFRLGILDDEGAIIVLDSLIKFAPDETSGFRPTPFFALVRLTYFLKRFNSKSDVWDAMVKWLTVCVRIDSDTNLFFERYKLDREEEVNRIIYDVSRDNGVYSRSDPLVNYILDVNDRNNVLSYLVYNWFLPRYDLASATLVIKALPQSGIIERIITWFKSVTAFLSSPISFFKRLALASLLMCILLIFSFAFHYAEFTNVLPFSNVGFDLSLTPGRGFEVFVCLVGFLGMAVSWIRAIILPRLIGGILVGYLFLISSDAIVTFAVSANPFTVYLVGAFSLGLSFLLLSFEIRRRVGALRGKLWERTTTLFSLGFIESTIIGLLVSDLFSDIFFQHIAYGTQRPTHFLGLLAGSMYPKVIVLFIPLALLVGIVLQLFWEEKPISQL